MQSICNLWRTLTVLPLLCLSACSMVPDKLRVPDGTQLINYTEVSQAPENYLGQQARWGGVIVSVNNLETKTLLEVVHFETYSSTKPKPKDDSAGRFRVYINRFLEPGIYTEGRLVSALGKIAPAETGKVDKHTIVYPVLQNAEIHLWPEQDKEFKHDYWRDPFWPYSSRWYWSRYHYLQPYYIPLDKKQRNRKKRKKAPMVQ
ncbi:Slp family lipoprotein [Catenovulum sediminis]|uniref:Slp family lipoprotein n=1 Tax=Catenovulum sediminis TaxID=1740262 RepID=UPI0011801A43|nr:Slp family lipoprotein [Catenovulum sediminis]